MGLVVVLWVPLLAGPGAGCSCEEPPPAILSVSIPGNGGSAQVRQGVGPVALEVSGIGLAAVTSATVGDLPTTLRAGGTDAGVTVDVVVAHGTPTGARDLSLQLSGGLAPLTHPAVIEVTPVTAAGTGSDLTGKGTRAAPFRTVSRALSLSARGDEVEIQAGLYDLVAGEQWVPTAPLVTTNVPDGVIVRGQGSAVTVLDGTGLTAQAAALVFAGGAALSGVTVRQFDRALLVSSGAVTVSDVVLAQNAREAALVSGVATLTISQSTVEGSGTGILAMNTATVNGTSVILQTNGVGLSVTDSAEVTLRTSAVRGSTTTGVAMARGSQVTLDGVTVDQNGTQLGAFASGVYMTVNSSGALTMRGGSLAQNFMAGLHAVDGVISLTGTAITSNGLSARSAGVVLDGVRGATLDGVSIAGNGLDGVSTRGAVNTILFITSSTLQNNGAAGLDLGAGAATVRASEISGNGTHGIRLLNRASLSLAWQPGEPQTRIIVPQATVNRCLEDMRARDTGAGVSSRNTLMNGVVAAARIVQGPLDGQAECWRIQNGGSPPNEIAFLAP
jgi:microcystin-dependent protein